MTWLFYILSGLLITWSLLALAAIAYSGWSAAQRRNRALLRGQIQETIRNATFSAGGGEFLDAKALAANLKNLAGKDRVCLRDGLIEQTTGMSQEALAPLREVYDILEFTNDDLRDVLQGRWYQKASASLRLGQLRVASSIEVLTGALRDSNSDVRMAAVCALAEIGDARSVSNIIYALADADGWQVLQVADKLIKMPVDITRSLLDLLQASGATKDRREAAARMVLELLADFGQKGCERLGVRAARIAALQFLNNDSIDMRARALRTIAAIGIETNEELEQILTKLHDKEWEVRAVAAKALGQLQQDYAIPALARSLSDEAWWVRHNAAHALAVFGRRGAEELKAQKLNPDRFARDIAQQVIEELHLDAALRTEN